MVSFCPGLLLMPPFCWNCTSDFISESTYEFVLREPLYDSNQQQVNSSFMLMLALSLRWLEGRLS